MAAITCDICGGSLSMDASGDFAVCDSCGMKHTKDRLRTKAQEITGTVEVSNLASIESLMKRGNLNLEDSKWDEAYEYFNKVLDINAEYAPAYMGKLCAELKINSEANLANQSKSFLEMPSYKKAIRFADSEYKTTLEVYEQAIKEHIEEHIQKIKKYKKYYNCISIGYGYTVGLKTDGTTIAVGNNDCGQCNTNNWHDIVAVSACSSHTVGLKSDGTVVAVGSNDYGQCNTNNWCDIIAISAGGNHTVGLKFDGTVVAVGSNKRELSNVSNWRNIVAISAGYSHTIGLKSDGTVVVVGSNEYGQCNINNWRDIVAISTEEKSTVGLKADGTVIVASNSKDSQYATSDWCDIIAISAAFNHIAGLKADGTVITTHYENLTSSWRDIIAIFTYDYITVGLKTDGKIVTVWVLDYEKNNISYVCNWQNIGPANKNHMEQKRIERENREEQEWIESERIRIAEMKTNELFEYYSRNQILGSRRQGGFGLQYTAAYEKGHARIKWIKENPGKPRDEFDIYWASQTEQEAQRKQEEETRRKRMEKLQSLINQELERRQKDEQRRVEQSKQWEQQGLCYYCGGQMSGFFTKKCKNCGKEGK